MMRLLHFVPYSLLSVGAGKRRTASVRTQSYANVFTLTRQDFEAAVTDYPELVERLKKKAKTVLRHDMERWEERRTPPTRSKVISKVNRLATGYVYKLAF